jgi:hypothetical protein
LAAARQLQRRNLAGGGGDMPVPQSAQAQLWQGHPYREGWESTMTWWYGSSFLLLVAILGFAPNTDIESWAKAEAMARLRSKDSVEFGTHRFNIVQENRDTTWDKFAVRSIRMTEDDDDDDEEEEEEGEDGDEEEEEEDDE